MKLSHIESHIPISISERPQPPSKPGVLQEDVKSRSVLLTWEPGSDGLSPVRYYTIQTRELPKGRWVVHSASISHNATSALVDRWELIVIKGKTCLWIVEKDVANYDGFLYRLKPFTSYKFKVKATNDIGDSEYSEESESLTTLQAGESHDQPKCMKPGCSTYLLVI